MAHRASSVAVQSWASIFEHASFRPDLGWMLFACCLNRVFPYLVGREDDNGAGGRFVAALNFNVFQDFQPFQVKFHIIPWLWHAVVIVDSIREMNNLHNLN